MQFDPSTAKTRGGCIVFYAKFPIISASKLQSLVAHSETEMEYIAMPMALCDVIPIVELLYEIKEKHFQAICTHPIVYCKVFEDNSGILELAQTSSLHQTHQHVLPPLP